VKKFVILCLCCALVLPPKASAYGSYAQDNPFVEAMLRMMEIFGLIDRSTLPLQVPYLPGGSGFTGFGGFPGTSPYAGLSGIPGMSPMPGIGGIPGMSPVPGMAGVPGMSPVPGMMGGGFPGSNGYLTGPGRYTWPGTPPRQASLLDGAWELDKGGFVIIRGGAARLYLTREKYQDFSVGYDRQYLWWTPRAGGSPSRYRYQMRAGRMILLDEEGSILLLRRRR